MPERNKALHRIVAIFATSMVLYMGGILFVVRVSADARQHNCQEIRNAFDEYTTALVKVSDPTPAERAAVDAKVAELRALTAEALSSCR